MKKFFKILLGIFAGFVLLIALAIGAVWYFSMPSHEYNGDEKKYMAEYFDSHEKQFVELRKFVAKHNTKNVKFYIEFERNYHSFWYRIPVAGEDRMMGRYDESEFLRTLGWDKKIFGEFRSKMKALKAFSYEDHYFKDNAVTIGLFRVLLDAYYYDIFDNNVSKDYIAKIVDNCAYAHHKDNVLIEWGEGVLSSVCRKRED